MPALVDLTGQRFGRWAVVRGGANNAHGQARWNCVCDCPDGSAGLVLGGSLRGGCSQSCGCLQRGRTREHLRGNSLGRKHGHAPRRASSPEYWAWEKANLVAKLRAARERKIAAGGRGSGRFTYAMKVPQGVALAHELQGERQSLRQISKTLAAQGHLTGGGRPYTATAIQKMLRGG